MARFRVALGRGVGQARDLGGHVQAAVWVDDWPAPIAVGDDLRQPMRMWSMAKPVEAVAALQFAKRERVQLTAGFTLAMERAIRRSENCSARRMVLELEQLAGGPAGARVAFAAVLRDAGARAVVASQREGAAVQSAQCAAFLEREGTGLADRDGEAVLFGTSRWTVVDAVRFARALANGTYGPAGAAVLETMAKPKQLSREPGAVFTADRLWGAGLAFRGYPLAYKAGWGGTQQGAFLAGQFALIEVGRHQVAVAAMFHPDTEPRIDDPGETRAPQALKDIFGAVATAFPELLSSSP